MLRSHKFRLAFLAFLAAAIGLAATFTIIVFASRHLVLGEEESELAEVLEGTNLLPDKTFDFEEFHITHPDYSVSVFGSDGTLLRSEGFPAKKFHLGTLHLDHRIWFGGIVNGERVMISSSLSQVNRGLERLTLVLIALWFPISLLVGVTTWIGAALVFRPLAALSKEANAISGAHLDQRLKTTDRAEFGAFAEQLNSMLDRISLAAQRQEEFASDAAHELRTPLALLRMRFETLLLRPRSTAEYEASANQGLNEIDRLTSLVESLLQTARSTQDQPSSVNLQPIVEAVVEANSSAAASHHLEVVLEAEDVAAAVLPQELTIVLQNLLDNAFRYGPEDTAIQVRLEQKGTEVRLEVADRGVGVPTQLRPRIFDRFVRDDESRNRGQGGAGIGLAVCKRLVEMRGGKLELIDSEPGATFRVTFPATAKPNP